jgi:tetratricopeptide (TPR) repeat protein
MKQLSIVVPTAAAAWLLLAPVPARAQELGTISFPTSGSASAQPAFLEGVKNLHSFEFDEARESFREAQQKDPRFAMAYWGEAMSYNHPLWAEQDTNAARATLERLAPTRDGRLAKAQLPKEKAYLEAVEILLYGPGDKLARDVAYSDAMRRLYEQHPGDHEIATFYALSLLGTVRPGDRGFRRQALAAAVAQKVYLENPRHPGAAHFIIHSFDDPDHAPLALPAARVYAGIAPAAAHALHMPSHIFVQLGMWEDVVASNKTAYEAAVALIKRRNLPEGREDFHTLSWLSYAYEMLGRYDQARERLELAKAALERNSANPRVRSGYLSMKARYIIESQRWEKIPVGAAANPNATDAHAGMPGMDHGGNANADELLAAGISAAKLGDLGTAERARAELRALREKTESGPTAYRAKPMAIMEREVAAHIAMAGKQGDEALRLMKEAADIELTLDKPSGPPEPIKPATELYGEILLELGRPKEAAAQFEQSLLRIPKRTPSLFGLARAAAKAGDRVTAQRSYSELVKIWSAAGPGFTPLAEAQQFLKSGSE